MVPLPFFKLYDLAYPNEVKAHRDLDLHTALLRANAGPVRVYV